MSRTAAKRMQEVHILPMEEGPAKVAIADGGVSLKLGRNMWWIMSADEARQLASVLQELAADLAAREAS